MTTQDILKQAKAAKATLAGLTTEKKNLALAKMADSLAAHTEAIIAANRMDMEAAKGKISPVLLERLMLDEKRIQSMAD